MRRACWTADFAEANIVTGLLLANGIRASVFDAGMAQLNWLQTLAIGGYRIMVADADAGAAHDLVAAYRKGELELPDEDAVQPTCPNCGGHENAENRNPRRIVFFLLLLDIGDLLLAGLFFVFVGFVPLVFAVAPQVFTLFCIALVSAAFVFLLTWVKNRYRCASCASTWQAEMGGFAALSHAADAAETTNLRPE